MTTAYTQHSSRHFFSHQGAPRRLDPLPGIARHLATALRRPVSASLRPLGAMILSLVTAGSALPLQAADFGVSIENITDLQGTLFWSVFDNEEDYETGTSPLLAGQSRVTAETLRFTLHDLPSGNYAIKLFHDANNNGELDANLLGLPQEGYGFSNNAGRFGPASFSEAAVQISADTQITIRLR